MSFRVGQKVVCVDAKHIVHLRPVVPLVEGAIYTVRGIWPSDNAGPEHLYLHEIVNDLAASGKERAYKSDRFRPIVSRKTDIFTSVPADPESERWDNRRKIGADA